MKERYIKPCVCSNNAGEGILPIVTAFTAGVAAGKAVGHALKGVTLPVTPLTGINVDYNRLAVSI